MTGVVMDQQNILYQAIHYNNDLRSGLTFSSNCSEVSLPRARVDSLRVRPSL